MEELMNEWERRLQNNSIMRELRDISNPFLIPENEFRRTFRFPRHLAHQLLEQIQPFMDDGVRITKIPTIVKLFATLHFYTQGSYQSSLGKGRDVSMAQSSVSRCMHEVTDVIVNHLSAQYIKFPETPDEIANVKAKFFQQFQFPGIIGAIDCTHIAIAPPPFGQIPPRIVYLNRKSFYSINCQIICDATLKILSINPRFPGSVHDAAIWHMSNIFQHMLQHYQNGNRTTRLLGDSAYPLQPFLLTPILGAENDTPEGRYTRTHCLARNTVERCIGVLKRKFRCINKERVLHYSPEVVGRIIVACCTLHNILKEANVIDDDDALYDNENNYGIDPNDEEVENNNLRQEGLLVRNNLIAQHFLPNVLH